MQPIDPHSVNFHAIPSTSDPAVTPSVDVVRPTSIKQLPDTGEEGGNIMTGLENALLEHFGYDPEKLSSNDRETFLKELMPKVTAFRGNIARQKAGDPESPFEFESYTIEIGDYKSKGIKIGMTWEIDVNNNGNTETIRRQQCIKTHNLLPSDPSDLGNIDHAKHEALLTTKFIRSIHKKAFLGDRFTLPSHKKTPIETDKLIQGLRATTHFDITHYPNPLTFGKDTSRLFNRVFSRFDGPALESKVTLETGYRIYTGYSERYDIKGRTIKAKQYQEGDSFPDGVNKANRAFNGFAKVNVENPRMKAFRRQKNIASSDEARGYGAHLQAQAGKIILKDPELDAYNDLLKMNTPDLKGELQNKQAALQKDGIHLDLQLLKELEVKSYRKSQKESKKLRDSCKKPLFSFVNPLIALFQRRTLKKGVRLLTKKLESAKAAYRNAKADYDQNQTADLLEQKREAAEILKEVYEKARKVREDLNKFQEKQEAMQRRLDHLRQLAPDASDKMRKSLHDHFLKKEQRFVDNMSKEIKLLEPFKNLQDVETILKTEKKI